METGKRQAARITATVFCVFALLFAICFAAPASKAYADDTPSYTISVTTDTQDITVATSAIGVSVDLACVGATEYPMYAFGATIRWDNKMLALVDFDPGDLDAYVTDYDGYSEIVLNYKSDSLEGTTWKSPQTVLKMTFKPNWAGTSSVTVERVNVANSTGLGHFDCTSTDASVTVAKAGGAAPTSSSSSASTTDPVASVVAALGDGYPIAIAVAVVLVAGCVVLVVRRKRAK